MPAMVPFAENGDYGYSEIAIALDLYNVTFVTPVLAAPGDPEQEYGLSGQKDRVNTLALWRAAELAIERGYPAFRVESKSHTIDVVVAEPPAAPPYVSAPMRTLSGPPCRWNCDNPIGYWGDPYFDSRYDDWYRRSHSSGRVSVTLTVRMLSQIAPDALDARETAQRLRTYYAASKFDVL